MNGGLVPNSRKVCSRGKASGTKNTLAKKEQGRREAPRLEALYPLTLDIQPHSLLQPAMLVSDSTPGARLSLSPEKQ